MGWLGQQAGDVITSGLQALVTILSTGLGEAIKTIVASWLYLDTPGVARDAGTSGSFDAVSQWTTDHTMWLAAFVATISIVTAGARMFWLWGSGGVEELRSMAGGAVRLVIATNAVIPGTRLLLWVGDRYSEWMLHQSGQDGATTGVGFVVGGLTATVSALGPANGFFLIGTTLVSTLVQAAMMSLRSALLVVLAATIAIPAAASMTESGQRWLGRWAGWLLAFICLKPAAATIYVAAFRLIGTDSNINSKISGLTLMAAAVVVLPGLLRLLQPAGTSIAGSAAGLGARRGGASGGASPGNPTGSQKPSSTGASSGSPSSTGGGGGSTSPGLTSSQPSGATRIGAGGLPAAPPISAASTSAQGAAGGGASAGSGAAASGTAASGGAGAAGGAAASVAGGAATGGALLAAQAVKKAHEGVQRAGAATREGLEHSAREFTEETGHGPSGS